MSNQEKDNFGNHEQFDEKKLAEVGKEHQERLKEDRERAVEQASERNAERARHEAFEHAAKIEKEGRHEKGKETSPAERRGPLTKRERDASYETTMREVRSQMSGPSRLFSGFIHNKSVERASDAVGGTIARPNAILAGSLFAFVFTLVVYLIARYNGYPLSGTETIASFVLGWLLGLVVDYLHALMTGKTQ